MNTAPTQSARRRRRSRGMTLIEILVVLAIIGLIVGGVSVVAFSALAESKVKAGYTGVIQLQGACERYLLEKNDKCPKTAADLKAANIIRAADLKDPWGEDYIITCPGEHGPVDVTSYGPDKKTGGGDDIFSWEGPKQKDDEKKDGK
jgi:general secretion pathway protein G